MESSLGRGQRLKSVINSYNDKRSENILDQLLKIPSYEKTNESVVKFCDEWASDEAESSLASMNSKRMNHSPSIVKSEGEDMWDYGKDFPSLGSQVSKGVGKQSNATHSESDVTKGRSDQYSVYQNNFTSWNNTAFNEDVAASTSQSPEQFSTIAKGIGRGQRLKMVADSLASSRATYESDIERALGTDCTNQSIERFVKELTEKNEKK